MALSAPAGHPLRHPVRRAEARRIAYATAMTRVAPNLTPDAFARVAMNAGLLVAALVALPACNPYAPAIGQSFTRIDEYNSTQRDEVPVILGGDILRGLRLTRSKGRGETDRFTVEASLVLPSSMRVHAISFDGGDRRIRLSGSSTIADVDARTYGVYYNLLAVFPIQPEQLRELSEFADVVIVVSGEIDLSPVRLGPKGLQAIDAFRERFVDHDGVGNNVWRSRPSTSD